MYVEHAAQGSWGHLSISEDFLVAFGKKLEEYQRHYSQNLQRREAVEIPDKSGNPPGAFLAVSPDALA